MSKEFDLGDVLSITTGRLVSPSHMGGVYNILNYMTGDDLFTHQLGRAAGICKPELLRQHPELDSGDVQFQVGRLIEMLETPSGKAEPAEMITGWLSGMKLNYGETLPVESLRPADYEHHDAIEELKTMVGEDRIVIVQHRK